MMKKLMYLCLLIATNQLWAGGDDRQDEAALRLLEQLLAAQPAEQQQAAAAQPAEQQQAAAAQPAGLQQQLAAPQSAGQQLQLQQLQQQLALQQTLLQQQQALLQQLAGQQLQPAAAYQPGDNPFSKIQLPPINQSSTQPSTQPSARLGVRHTEEATSSPETIFRCNNCPRTFTKKHNDVKMKNMFITLC
jgi:hypothetical protein